VRPYEGVDERVRELLVTDEISIGDYVLSGGEVAAMGHYRSGNPADPCALGDPGAAFETRTPRACWNTHTIPAMFSSHGVPEVCYRATTPRSCAGGVAGTGRTWPAPP